MQRRTIITALLIVIGLVVVAAGVYFGGKWLWGELAAYVRPDDATERKDLVNIFVLIAAGVVGTLTAIAAVGNLIVSRRNLQNAQATLQQQRDLDERRAQDDALQSYYKEIGSLLTTHKLMDTTDADDPKRLLARAQTLTMLERLGSESNRAMRKKRELMLFLYDAGLIAEDTTIVNLANAHLSRADLSHADLSGATLSFAFLNDAVLANADLSHANLRDADLSGATLSEADLSGATLSDAEVTEEQLAACKSLERATMPNGQKYEE